MKKANRKSDQMLSLLGATGDYMGTKFLEIILDIVSESEESLTNISKLLYAECAKTYNTSIYCVERDIRTVIRLIWDRGNRSLLEEVAGKQLLKCPSNGDFIRYITSYLRDQGI